VQQKNDINQYLGSSPRGLLPALALVAESCLSGCLPPKNDALRIDSGNPNNYMPIARWHSF
jgi:hypothetical protein